MKKHNWIRSLCALLCLLLLAGCTPPAEQPPAEQPSEETLLTIIDGQTDYNVIRGEYCDKSVTTAAAALRTSLIAATGVEVGIKTDLIPRDPEDAAATHELLVGQTNRPESEQVYATLGEEDYAICVVGQAIVIIGKTDRLTVIAVETFLRELLQYDAQTDTYGVTTLKIDKDYNMKQTYVKQDVSVDQALIDDLALCVTEGGVPLSRDAIFSRFADYAEMGLTAVRVDLHWAQATKDSWKLADASKYHFEAAKKYGLKLKVILNPGGANPSWLNPSDYALMDDSGNRSINAISPWYDGAAEYTETSLRGQLDALLALGYEDVIGGIVLGLGPAGEPLYPPQWTQTNPRPEEVMWCYAPNAQADFRATMEQEYSSIQRANAHWGTDYQSFDEIDVPKIGEAKGKLWGDVLEWYRDSKRDFVKLQLEIATELFAEFELADRPVILYLPGADYTQEQWDNCVETGTAIPGIRIMCDNEYTVQLAEEYNCLLQYTGITGVAGLALCREYMFENGYAHIPVMGENAGGSEPAAQAQQLHDIITKYKLWGIDYTHSHWLYEEDGVSHSIMYEPLVETVAKLKEYLKTVDITQPPEEEEQQASTPDGAVLKYELSFNKPANASVAFAFASILQLDFEVLYGDTLEYDVYLSDDMAGLGSLDGMMDGKTLRDGFNMVDTTGHGVHPVGDLSGVATQKWYHRTILLGNAAADGCTLTEIQVAAHPEEKDGSFTQCDVTVYYDNIVIKRDGEVVYTIFADDGDVTESRATHVQHARGEVSICDISEVK